MTNSRPVAGFLVVLEPAALSSKIPFFFGENLIGRSESKADVVIKEPSISQKHAKLIATPNKITITDLSSKNGTKINNEGNYIES
jgi:pSer/pThr/pTyr-binding forkhead associated (FHA) protein